MNTALASIITANAAMAEESYRVVGGAHTILFLRDMCNNNNIVHVTVIGRYPFVGQLMACGCVLE